MISRMTLAHDPSDMPSLSDSRRASAHATTGKQILQIARRRIVLIRHGQPTLLSGPRTNHRGFCQFISDYEAAGLDTHGAPPAALAPQLNGIGVLFTSHSRRAQESAQALAPSAKVITDPLFAEAALASPPIPLLKMSIPSWAVLARVLWHLGYHPQIENYRDARQRASAAAQVLLTYAEENNGTAALVGHGYFNAMIGRALRQQGFVRRGKHRATFWNTVIYEKS